MKFAPPRIKFTIRVKILILFLVLSLAALAVTGYFAFSSINNVGDYAKNSSEVLGEGVANNSSVTLLFLGESYLVRTTADQANLTDALFQDTDSEIEILAAQTAELQRNPPVQSSLPTYPESNPPANSSSGAVLFFAPGATATPGSEEARTLTGLADNLKAVYNADTEMTGVYIATDSGMLLFYPGVGNFPTGFDPRTREWFFKAKGRSGPVWSEKPYFDAAFSSNLIMTCSEAVSSPDYGTWVIGSDVSTKTIDEDYIGQTLGNDGYAVLLNEKGDVISSPEQSPGEKKWDDQFIPVNAFSINNSGLSDVAENMTSGLSGTAKVSYNGTEIYVAYAPVRSMNWSLALSLPASQILGPVEIFTDTINTSTQGTENDIDTQTKLFGTVFSILFVVILLVVFLVSVVLSRVITRPVSTLKKGTAALSKGDLDFRVSIHSGDEFEDLAHSFNQMASALKDNIENLRKTTAEKERYAKELEIARSIQTSFLPENMPEIAGYDISAVMIPAMEVGGDFYDFIPAGEGKWAFIVADVSGKGVSAALFMAMSRTLLRASLEGTTNLSGALSAANRMIAQNAPSGMFVTVFSALLDPVNRTLTSINAGHNPPIVVRSGGGEPVFLKEDGIAMGVLTEMRSTPDQIDLGPGDLVILYTDGVTEAFDARYTAFGEERLAGIVKKYQTLPASTVMERIISGIREFTGSAPQSDDITLVVIRVLPKS
ncbi:MAG: SpoIIE family protein phosphatase [Methanoregula sp.]|uniref:SpoIIE family protein phosphatase n=3 Tax=Methanoregula sp. TaxID=2052170 RepID=UPI003BB1FC3D